MAERGKGRTTAQTEAWVSERLLPTLSQLAFIDFPVEIARDDRPDLKLSFPSCSAGIELTEVVPPAYAQAVAIRNQKYSNATVARSIFTWGKQFSPQDIHKHLGNVGTNLTGPGWTKDLAETELAAAVKESIVKKTIKLNNAGFAIYSSNWLAIYASLPGPEIDLSHACSYLKKIPLVENKRHCFDTVFVLIRKHMVMLTNTKSSIYDIAVI